MPVKLIPQVEKNIGTRSPEHGSITHIGMRSGYYQHLTVVFREASKLIWSGLAVAIASGTLMFASTPKLYFYSSAFVLKMALLVVAVPLQLLLFRRVAASDPASVPLGRDVAVVTLATWFSPAMAGRFIAFV